MTTEEWLAVGTRDKLKTVAKEQGALTIMRKAVGKDWQMIRMVVVIKTVTADVKVGRVVLTLGVEERSVEWW